MNPWLHERLAGKWDNHNSPKELFSERIAPDPKAHVGQIVAGLTHAERRVQNGCAELASLLTEQHPKLLYKHLDAFVNNLDAPEAVLRWEAVCTLGNLAQADDNATLLRHVPAIARHLNDKSIVLQGHAARALAKIAQRFPEQSDRILDALLEAKGKFSGSRIGYLVDAMIPFASQANHRARVLGFVQPLASSQIASVAKKVRQVLRVLDATDGDVAKCAAPPKKRKPSGRSAETSRRVSKTSSGQ